MIKTQTSGPQKGNFIEPFLYIKYQVQKLVSVRRKSKGNFKTLNPMLKAF